MKLGIQNEFEIQEGDIKSSQTIEKLISKYQPERIFNLAAQSSVGISISEPVDTIRGIALGTLNLLEISRKINYSGRIFFAGSSEIFGNTTIPANIHHQQHNYKFLGHAFYPLSTLLYILHHQSWYKCIHFTQP